MGKNKGGHGANARISHAKGSKGGGHNAHVKNGLRQSHEEAAELAVDQSSDDHAVQQRNSELVCKEVQSSDLNPLQGLVLRMWDFSHCDPKRCTGSRLVQRGILKRMPLKQSFRGIVLSPRATVSVSPADLPILEKSGMLIIFCALRQAVVLFRLCSDRNGLLDRRPNNLRIPDFTLFGSRQRSPKFFVSQCTHGVHDYLKACP
jgi:Possible Fer4-like domain in RNase L inhibitor, RLI